MRYEILFNLLAVCLLLMFGGLACIDIDNPHPSDSSLEENFYKHEADFDLLAQMAIEDADMIRIAPTFTWHEKSVGDESKAKYGFSDERWNEYKRLFQRLGRNNGILNYQPNLLLVLASSRGLVTGGSSKGYAYSSKEPSSVFDSLDDINFNSFNNSSEYRKVAYKRLKDKWYLFYDVN